MVKHQYLAGKRQNVAVLNQENEIINHWDLNTPEKIRKTALQLKELLMNEEYRIFFKLHIIN